jgi:hypothetical protein
MDYEKAYKEALERAKKFKSPFCQHAAEVIFPELKESENERIRKGLIKGLYAMRDIHKHQTFSDDAIDINDAIAWLEKQGNYDYKRVNLNNFDDRIREFSDMLEDKPKPYWDGWYEAMEWVRTHGNPFEKHGEQKPTNESEPKFKVGDWILIDVPCQIQSIDENGNYMVKYCDCEEISTLSRKFCESHFHIWTIEDTKGGDVLTTDSVHIENM